jgi:hypothetical protein
MHMCVSSRSYVEGYETLAGFLSAALLKRSAIELTVSSEQSLQQRTLHANLL